MKKLEIKTIIKEVERDSRGDTTAFTNLNNAKAAFANAIVNVNPMKIMKTYKDLAQYVDAYVEEIYHKQ